MTRDHHTSAVYNIQRMPLDFRETFTDGQVVSARRYVANYVVRNDLGTEVLLDILEPLGLIAPRPIPGRERMCFRCHSERSILRPVEGRPELACKHQKACQQRIRQTEEAARELVPEEAND